MTRILLITPSPPGGRSRSMSSTNFIEAMTCDWGPPSQVVSNQESGYMLARAPVDPIAGRHPSWCEMGLTALGIFFRFYPPPSPSPTQSTALAPDMSARKPGARSHARRSLRDHARRPQSEGRHIVRKGGPTFCLWSVSTESTSASSKRTTPPDGSMLVCRHTKQRACMGTRSLPS